MLTSMATLSEALESSVGVKSSANLKQTHLSRIFLSLADCNLDYSSSPSFQTPSRMVLRVGDLRISSNMVRPQLAKQAFSIALSDGSLYLCKGSYPYNFENDKIPRSGIILPFDYLDLKALGLGADPSPEMVLADMEYVTIATLGSCDAVLAISQLPSKGDALFQLSMTTGELCVYACTDSFARLVATLSELSTQVTALDRSAFEALRKQSSLSLEEDTALASPGSLDVSTEWNSCAANRASLQMQLQEHNVDNEFLLDGYDWTTVQQDESSQPRLHAAEEQSARWYSDVKSDDRSPTSAPNTIATPFFSVGPMPEGPRLLPNHFPFGALSWASPESHELEIKRLVGASLTPSVRNRMSVHDLCIKIRFFDGYDWPDQLSAAQRRLATDCSFILDNKVELPLEETESKPQGDTKSELLRGLVAADLEATSKTFTYLPLPEERGAQLKAQAERRRLGRRTAKYFQFVLSGISLRLDLLEPVDDHRLASCLSLKIQDFFAAETISGDRPIKMAGEWLSDADHPRESTDGLCALKVSRYCFVITFLNLCC
jgi:hypothetical protein